VGGSELGVDRMSSTQRMGGEKERRLSPYSRKE